MNVIKPAWSMQKRLVLAMSVLLILFLGLAGLVLTQAYRESVAAAVAERLQLQIYALLGVAEPEGGGFFVPGLAEARYSQIDSGLYAFILTSEGREIWRSTSALNLASLDMRQYIRDEVEGEIETGETLYGTQELEGQGELAWASYATYWESQDETYIFVVLESTEPSTAEIRQFQSSMYLWFGALALVLSVAQYALLRWGMRPLQKLAEDVSAIEAGKRDQLQSDYPRELLPVTENLNLLIKSERERQSRYRTTLGDLAHSLKTPLAVLSSALQDSRSNKHDEALGADNLREMEEQLRRMDEIISYQLKKAARSQHAKVLVKPVPVAGVVEPLIGALKKVYRDKHMQVRTGIEENAEFFGDDSDLMEVCGNLLDNAFKYGRSRVEIAVKREAGRLLIEVNDDGEGIAEQHRHWVLQRGARADAVTSGQGIGLAVTVDIVRAYGGEIRVSRNAMGGARLEVSFQLPESQNRGEKGH